MKGKSVSIKWRIFGYFLLFSLIMLLLLWLFQTVFLEAFYKSSKMAEVQECSNAIAANAENEELPSLIERMAQQYEVCIRVVDETGRDILQADLLPGCVIHKLPRIELARLYAKTELAGGAYLERFSRNGFINHRYEMNQFTGKVPPVDQGMPESIVYGRIITMGGESRLVLLNTTLSPVNATVETLRRQLMYITVILVILGLCMALFMARRIYGPIVKITDAAKGLARGSYTLTLEDGTYREAAELNDTLHYACEELGKVEQLRGELVANISHDLRTPLTMITAYAEGMRDLPGENTPENVQVIIDEAERLTTLVNDVLDLSKLQSGAQELTLAPFDISASISNVIERYQKLMEQRGYTISFTSPGPVTITADEGKVQQVLYNLINNAITYTGADGRIVVTEEVRNDGVRISVRDTGEGIPQEDLPHIWDRYYRSSQAHKRAQVGTGLGLSIVRSLVELHGGTYGVQTDGNGTTFWFTLPC
ncbi:MAG: HAMP domain-containing histidine kinase [Clostridiales bacterium]|nr:HAMP domain-containing histidine kinase [Clostridiales bacterium]